jgi:DNA modification methylase
MGKSWDASGIAYNINLWKECLRVLKPGGHLLSFGGSRTYHRMACAIEDAGFEIRDQIQWLYGSGFPKSLDISKALDKRRCKVDIGIWIQKRINTLNIDKKIVAKYCDVTPRQVDHWVGVNTPCPQNPTEEKFLLLEEVLQDKPLFREQFISQKGEEIGVKTHQRSGGNDFAKIVGSDAQEKEEVIYDIATPEAQQWNGWGTALKPAHEPIVVARKPLSEKTVADNVLKWGTGGININGCRIETDELKNKVWNNGSQRVGSGGSPTGSKEFHYSNGYVTGNSIGRFPANVILDEEAGKLLDEQSGVKQSTRHMSYKRSGGDFIDGIPSQPEKDWFVSETGGASRFFYCAKASKKERGEGNNHPTVKPIKLIEYLIKLVTPPNGTVLDPFMGSGTTAIAARNLGFNYLGFEQEKEYCEIANKRLKIA